MAARTTIASYVPARLRRPPPLVLVVCCVGVLTSAALAAIPQQAFATQAPAPNSADRAIFWSDCDEVVELDDFELDEWRERGVRGFECGVQWLPGMGGTGLLSPDLRALEGPSYALERRIVASGIVERLHDRGMKFYLGAYLANATNAETPLATWFDDQEWTNVVLPTIREFAATARALGADGIAFDQELYPDQNGNATATWSWDHPGRTRSERAVRNKVRDRGSQMMSSILQGYPEVDILAYATQLPETWEELVQEEINNIPAAFEGSVNFDLWNGMTSVVGYGSITFLDAIFYKTTHLRGADWDGAFTYHFNRTFAMLSRRLPHWSAAADRLNAAPFVWISAGSTRFEAARDPAYVAEQLLATRRWGMGRVLANYTSDTLRSFDYDPYLEGLRVATRPGVVDDSPPSIRVDPVDESAAGSTVDLSGRATDDQAIRIVRWSTGDASGAAEMRWVAEGNPSDGWSWHMNWVAKGIPLGDGTTEVTLSVEDIKGLTKTRVVEVKG